MHRNVAVRDAMSRASRSGKALLAKELAKKIAKEEACRKAAGGGKACKGHPALRSPGMGLAPAGRKQKSNARARHEAASAWLRQLSALAAHFRRAKPRREARERHKQCPGAAAAAMQLKLSHGEKACGAGCSASYF